MSAAFRRIASALRRISFDDQNRCFSLQIVSFGEMRVSRSDQFQRQLHSLTMFPLSRCTSKNQNPSEINISIFFDPSFFCAGIVLGDNVHTSHLFCVLCRKPSFHHPSLLFPYFSLLLLSFFFGASFWSHKNQCNLASALFRVRTIPPLRPRGDFIFEQQY